MIDMVLFIEALMAIICIMLGLSHAVQPRVWVGFFTILAGHGKAGVVINGLLTLAAGALIVAGHSVWSWPGIVLTVYGYILVVKAAVIFLFPSLGLKSLALVEDKPGHLYAAAAMLLFVGTTSAWAYFLNSA